MNKERDLLVEMNITEHKDETKTPLDVDIAKIKDMVNNKIKADSSCFERKTDIMKSKKKISLIAIAATLVLGITAFATSGVIKTWYSSSSSNPEYKTLPTEEQCLKDVGYVPVLIETFENGYTFVEGSVVNNAFMDEKNNSIEEFKSLDMRYEKDGDMVNFSQDKYYSTIEDSGDIIANINGVDVCYFSYTNKVVPADYQMTDADKKAEENGELVFSYGSDEVEIIEVQNVSWQEDGICYSLLQLDGKLSAEDLVAMAEEIINTK